MKKVYLDNAATTALDERVLNKMLPYMRDIYGNASGVHLFSREAMSAIDRSRRDIASLLNCFQSEIFFTSGGTESDNWAIRGVAQSLRHKGNHIITTQFEHPAVLAVCKYLSTVGYDVTYIGVSNEGYVSVDDIEKAIRPETILVSVMYANNEIGTIQPIRQIADVCHKNNVLFHTDAVQAIGSENIDVRELDVDLLSASAHKFYGPKGVGFLYVKQGTPLGNYLFGGMQESGKRAGTLNSPGIVGMVEALKLCRDEQKESGERIKDLCDKFIGKMLRALPICQINGGNNRLKGTINLCFTGVKNEALLTLLDMNGIAASGGSACSAGSLEPSHVLLAIGKTPEEARSSIRFSFGKYNTAEEIDYAAQVIIDAVCRLSPDSDLIKYSSSEGDRI